MFSAGSSLTYHLAPFVLNMIATSRPFILPLSPKALFKLFYFSCSQPSTLHHIHYPYTTSLSSLICSLSLDHHIYAVDTQLFSFHLLNFDSSISHLQNALQ